MRSLSKLKHDDGLKGHGVVLEKKFKNKVPGHSLKLEKWQGPPHINKCKQYETVLSFKVSLFIQSRKF